MKQSIQKTARIGLSLFLLVGLLAGILALSGAQPVHAWGPVIVVDDFNTGAFTLTGPNNSIMGVSTAGAIGGDRDVIILDSPATAGNHPVPSVMSLTEGDGYLNLAVGNQPYMYAIEWGRGLLEWDSGMHSANALNLDVSNHDRIIVTLSEAPSSGSIGVGIYKAGGHFSFIFSPQSLSGAGEYTFLMSYLDNYVDYQNVEGIRLYFTGMPASSTIRVDSMVIRSQPCPAGQYDNGSGCVDADPGYYVPDAGATSQIPCLAGYYQDQAGATSCKPASAGSYVSTTGATSATFCPAGKYQPYVGQTSCIPADPGYYVPGSGAIEQLMCEVGYTSDAGAVECYKINTAPTANAGGPYLGAVNTSIAFDGSASSDPEADSLTYAWDFGDGGSGTGAMPSHSYSATDIYDVCLTVNDGALDSSPDCTTALVYAFAPGGGTFVVGDQTADGSVTFWGSQWAKLNTLSGGKAPSSFKGFAVAPESPSCGVNWSTGPGNSSKPPAGPLPDYMAVIVASSISKAGPTISGNTVSMVVVQTNPGYNGNPGHAGTGTVIATICP